MNGSTLHTHSTLATLGTGRKGRLKAIGHAEARITLMNMGLVPGDILEVTDVAVGGCPIAIRVHGSKIALRRSLARHIEVEAL